MMTGKTSRILENASDVKNLIIVMCLMSTRNWLVMGGTKACGLNSSENPFNPHWHSNYDFNIVKSFSVFCLQEKLTPTTMETTDEQ